MEEEHHYTLASELERVSPAVTRSTRAKSATSSFKRIRLPVSTRCTWRTRRKSG